MLFSQFQQHKNKHYEIPEALKLVINRDNYTVPAAGHPDGRRQRAAAIIPVTGIGIGQHKK